MDVFIGKQPIFNLHDEIICYELLYRDQHLNEFPHIDGDIATKELLINAFLTIGIQQLTEGKLCFINFSEGLLMSDFLDYFQHDHIVVEILPNVEITPSIITRIIELKSFGYRISVDASILKAQTTHVQELFTYINFCSIDFLTNSASQRANYEQQIQFLNPQIQLVAKKLEHQEAYEEAKQKGYTLFQGYFFEHPKVMSTKDIPSNTMHYFELITLLSSCDPDILKISAAIERDLSLTYKILQLANTTSQKLKIHITSIKQAIMLLGLTELQKWIYLLAIREQTNEHSKFEQQLLKSALFRAKVCEQLARQKQVGNVDEYFLIGMFSNIEAILTRSLPYILNQLPLSQVIKDTLLYRNTESTPYLNFSVALDKLDWPLLAMLSEQLDIPHEQIEPLYSSTTTWVDQIFETWQHDDTKSPQ